MNTIKVHAGFIKAEDTIVLPDGDGNPRVVTKIETPGTWVRFHFADGGTALRDCSEAVLVVVPA